jgi:hypothetical protein
LVTLSNNGVYCLVPAVSLGTVVLSVLVVLSVVLVLLVSLGAALVSRGPSVSCGVEVWVVSATPVFCRAVVLSRPTLSGVTVALPGRPATPGGPVRVLSIA